VLLYLGALALRLPGYDSGLIYRSEPDTYIVTQVEDLDHRGWWSRYDAAWKYPLLLAKIVAAVPDPTAAPPPPVTLEQHLEVSKRRHAHVRWVLVFLAAGIAPATFLLARGALGRRWATLAGVLAATSLLHLCYSYQARPHATAAVTTTLALAACARFAGLPTLGAGLAVGLATGAALATLHTGVFLFAPLGVAALRAWRRVGRRALGPLALAVGLIVGAAVWAYTPGERILAARAAAATAAVPAPGSDVPAIRFGGHVVAYSLLDGGGFGRTWSAFRDYEPVTLTLSLLALALGLRAIFRRRVRATETAVEPGRDLVWVVAGFCVPALLAYGVYTRTPPRFLIAFAPLLAVGAATGARSLARLVPRTPARLVVALAVLGTLTPGLWLARLRLQPDSVRLATEWLAARCEADGEPFEVLCLNVLSLPVVQRADVRHSDSWWMCSRWETYQAQQSERDDGAAAAALGVGVRYLDYPEVIALTQGQDPDAAAAAVLARYDAPWVLLGTSVPNVVGAAWDRRPVEAFERALGEAGYERIEVFPNSRGAPPDLDLGYEVTLPLLVHASRFGPRIEAWRQPAPR